MSGRRLCSLLVFGLIAGCFPERVGLEGKQCEQDCPGDLVCIQGTCRPVGSAGDPTVPTVRNGDFESGADGWTGASRLESIPNALAGKGLRVNQQAGDSEMDLRPDQAPVHFAKTGHTYCVTAYVRVPESFDVDLQVFTDGDSASDFPVVSVGPTPNTWTAITASLKAASSKPITFALSADPMTDSLVYFDVDDVAMTRSVSGTCN